MSCASCELKRAKLLIQARQAVDVFDVDEIMREMEYRWPDRFYLEVTSPTEYRILQRNKVAPYWPNEVFRGFYCK